MGEMTPELKERLRQIRLGQAGKAFRPSNGTEGMIFEENFCCRCMWSEAKPHRPACELMGLAMLHEVYEHEYPHQWKYDAEGNPTCTAFNEKSPPIKVTGTL